MQVTPNGPVGSRPHGIVGEEKQAVGVFFSLLSNMLRAAYKCSHSLRDIILGSFAPILINLAIVLEQLLETSTVNIVSI
jgi:hypothetical protein